MDKKGIRLTVPPAVLRAVGQGMAQPSLQAGYINYIGWNRSGVATSTYYLFGDVGQSVGPMLGGMALEAIAGIGGYQFLFYVCAALLAGGCMIFKYLPGKKLGITRISAFALAEEHHALCMMFFISSTNASTSRSVLNGPILARTAPVVPSQA